MPEPSPKPLVTEGDARERAVPLGRFAKRVPDLVSARSLPELAQVSAAVTLDVLDAEECVVLLRQGGSELRAHTGPIAAGPALEAWANVRLATEPDDIVDDGYGRIAIRMRSRTDHARGIVAARLPVWPSASAAHDMLSQIGLLVSVCADNLVLYEEVERALRARDDVIAVVSHDLRSPLNTISLGTSLLRDVPEAQRAVVLARVERNVAHMTRLVDDLVDMVRVETGKFVLCCRDERASELLRAAAQLIADQAAALGLRLHSGEQAAGDLRVRADRDRVLQVLANLLSNALKFTPAGGEIELSAEPDGEYVRFCVRDTGPGIPAGEAQKIFARFWQSDPKSRRGLGLGLHIAKGIVQAHGGRLWLESREGAGSQFFFTLPSAIAGVPGGPA